MSHEKYRELSATLMRLHMDLAVAKDEKEAAKLVEQIKQTQAEIALVLDNKA